MQQTTRCSSCGTPNPINRKFCISCGAQLGNSCPNCGANVDPVDRFCGSCGAQVSVVVQPQPPVQNTYQQSWSQPQSYGGAAAPQQREYKAPQSETAAYEASSWEPEVSKRRSSLMPMVLLLIVLLIGLGVFAYLAFGTSIFNPHNQTPNTVSTALQITGPFVKPGIVTDNTSTVKDYTIYWITDQATIGKVDYGTSENYTSSSDWESALTKSHSITLNSLVIGLRYNYRIENKDSNGNLVQSANNTFGAY